MMLWVSPRPLETAPGDTSLKAKSALGDFRIWARRDRNVRFVIGSPFKDG
jgi:hypothetical protein